MDFLFITLLFFSGFIIGVLAALFGIGGAVIAIPLFRILLGFSGSEAIATALPLAIPTALSGAYHFSKYNLIKYKTAIFGGVTGILFSVLGAYLTMYSPSQSLMLGFGIMLFLLAYITFKTEKAEANNIELTDAKEKAWVTGLIGAFAGFVSGFFGIGGGALLVPLLMRLRNIEIKKAVATSLVMIAIYAVPGAAAHYFLGNVNLSVLTVILAGALLGTKIGVGLAIKLEEKVQRTLLSVILVIIGIVIISHELLLLA